MHSQLLHSSHDGRVVGGLVRKSLKMIVKTIICFRKMIIKKGQMCGDTSIIQRSVVHVNIDNSYICI